jgi:hypothetical protein
METLDLNIQFLDALCGRSLIRWDHTPTKNGAPKKILGDFQKLEIFFHQRNGISRSFFTKTLKISRHVEDLAFVLIVQDPRWRPIVPSV